VSLPLTSAPVIFFLALEQGSVFASRACEGTILGLASLSAFDLVYSWLSRRSRIGWLYPMLLGWGIFFVLTFLLEDLSGPLIVSFVAVAIMLIVVIMLLPKSSGLALRVSPISNLSNEWQIVTRMIAATALVLVITEAAPLLGAQLSGLLTPFPIYVSVLAASAHRFQGAASAVELVRGATLGLFTPAVFSLIVGSLIVGSGIGVSFGLAIAVSLVVHGVLLRILRQGKNMGQH